MRDRLALKMMATSKDLESMRSKMDGIFAEIKPLAGLGKEIRSSNLGRVLGSRLQAYVHMLPIQSDALEEGRKDFCKVIKQFDSATGCSRQYQNRAMLECMAGNLAAALSYLSSALVKGYANGQEAILRKF